MLLSSRGGYFDFKKHRSSSADLPVVEKAAGQRYWVFPSCEFYGLKWWGPFVPTDSGYQQFCERACTRTMPSYCQKRKGQ
eukprot:6394567-Pyramimonas_sp.AAC.1